jgi:predicted RNA binding protein YcfA (HicA-like mRNA interferase family)
MRATELLRRLRRRANRLGLEHEESPGKGSHRKVRHDGHATVVPVHGGDLAQGTYRAILRQLGLTDQNLEDE